MTLILFTNGAFYFSEFIWNSPYDSLKFRREGWEFLGNDGWSMCETVKIRRGEVFALFDGFVPEFPGEYSVIYPPKQTPLTTDQSKRGAGETK